MINFTNRTNYYISTTPTDMRKGREGLALIIRETMQRNPLDYNSAFIFYSKDYRKEKILHYDLNGYVMYETCHQLSREVLILLLSTAVQTKIAI